jgi:AmiR/NasT family two-component response regulator
VAKGIVMTVRGCSPEDAFAYLVKRSMHTNTKLRDVADQIVKAAQERNQDSI